MLQTFALRSENDSSSSTTSSNIGKHDSFGAKGGSTSLTKGVFEAAPKRRALGDITHTRDNREGLPLFPQGGHPPTVKKQAHTTVLNRNISSTMTSLTTDLASSFASFDLDSSFPLVEEFDGHIFDEVEICPGKDLFSKSGPAFDGTFVIDPSFIPCLSSFYFTCFFVFLS